jgi:hypothetical protein
MGIDSLSFDGRGAAQIGQARDAEDIAAALLLREVEQLLKDGQPRHAIAHIMECTGVERDQAAQFVAEFQSGVFQKDS